MKLHSIASAGGGDIAGLMGLQSPGPVGLIYNPRSAGNRGRVPIRVPGIPSASPETRQELARALADFARREVRVVIVCGGDGTIREVLSAIPSAYLGAPTPGLAIVAAGNTDLIAGEVGAIRRSDDIGLLAARGREGSLRVTRRPVVAVERAIDDRGDARSIRGLLFGAGIFARATEIGQRLSQSDGSSHAAMIARTVAILARRLVLEGDPEGLLVGHEIGLSVDQNDETFRHSFRRRFLVLVSGLRERLFLGRTLFWGGGAESDLRYLSIDAPARNLVRSFASVAMNRPCLAGDDWTSGATSAIAIRTTSAFVVDGELFRPDESGIVRLRASAQTTFLSP